MFNEFFFSFLINIIYIWSNCDMWNMRICDRLFIVYKRWPFTAWGEAEVCSLESSWYKESFKRRKEAEPRPTCWWWWSFSSIKYTQWCICMVLNSAKIEQGDFIRIIWWISMKCDTHIYAHVYGLVNIFLGTLPPQPPPPLPLPLSRGVGNMFTIIQ